MKVEALDHLVVNVTDVERSADWYKRVLGMQRLDSEQQAGQHRTAMLFGRQKINLRPMSVSKQAWFTADHEAAGSDDLCFLTSMSSSPTATTSNTTSATASSTSPCCSPP